MLDAALPRPARDPTGGRFRQVLLGRDHKQRLHISFALMPMGIHAAWACAYAWAAIAGWTSVAASAFMIATNLVGIFGVYAWLRNGSGLPATDRALAVTQMVWACASAICGYVLVPPLRPALLQAICLAQVCGMFGPPSRALARGGVLVVAMLAALMALAASGRVPGLSFTAEGFVIAETAVLVLLLTGINRHHSKRREHFESRHEALKHALSQVEDQARKDALTGLFNRRHMHKLLDAEVRRCAQGAGGAFAVALIDLDHFKRINDAYGHSVGDEVLRSFSALMPAALRATDAAARWGGEEFLVLLPETPPGPGAATALATLARALRQAPPVVAGMSVTFSAGIAHYRIGEPIEQTIARSDEALYAAKVGGRDRVTSSD